MTLSTAGGLQRHLDGHYTHGQLTCQGRPIREIFSDDEPPPMPMRATRSSSQPPLKASAEKPRPLARRSSSAHSGQPSEQLRRVNSTPDLKPVPPAMHQSTTGKGKGRAMASIHAGSNEPPIGQHERGRPNQERPATGQGVLARRNPVQDLSRGPAPEPLARGPAEFRTKLAPQKPNVTGNAIAPLRAVHGSGKRDRSPHQSPPGLHQRPRLRASGLSSTEAQQKPTVNVYPDLPVLQSTPRTDAQRGNVVRAPHNLPSRKAAQRRADHDAAEITRSQSAKSKSPSPSRRT